MPRRRAETLLLVVAVSVFFAMDTWVCFGLSRFAHLKPHVLRSQLVERRGYVVTYLVATVITIAIWAIIAFLVGFKLTILTKKSRFVSS